MNLRPLLIVPPILLGIIGYNLMNRQADTPVDPPQEIQTAVRVIEVQPHPVSATAVGYGRAEAVRDWSAISEVQGRITALSPGLAVGSIVSEGAVLAQIDRTDHEIARQKSLANIAAAEAQLSELERQEESSRTILEVEERILDVAQAEFDRVDSLVGRGATTQASLDSARKALLAQETAVTNLRNTIALYPVQRKSLEATREVRRAELAEAERALEKASIAAPFRGRVAELQVETGQFVRTGDLLLTLEDVSAVEITAEIQPMSFVPLVSLAFGDQFDAESEVDVSQAVRLLSEAGVTAEAAMSISGISPAWPAEIVRLRGTIDDVTGTLGLVVRVDDPLISRRQIGRPPLNVGTFVAVTFSTEPLDGSVTIPRSALRYRDDGVTFVWLADADSRLAARDIEVGQVLGADVLVLSGLDGGETLVLSDPQPPVPGMALAVVPATPSTSAVAEQ